ISTESKVFSIYAVGVVKGFKRETRVRIHAVVDFRGAPSLSNLSSMAASLAGPAGAPSASPIGGQTLPGSNSGALTNALAPSVDGQILYYNIE
ncbi:MAG: general secretion pathway protein GspK, partial [Polyangiaceae bacterium]